MNKELTALSIVVALLCIRSALIKTMTLCALVILTVLICIAIVYSVVKVYKCMKRETYAVNANDLESEL